MILTLIGASDIYLKMQNTEYFRYSHFFIDEEAITYCKSRRIWMLGLNLLLICILKLPFISKLSVFFPPAFFSHFHLIIS